ncbi:maleylpyruvate isomerase family mycothiol-dependent enzyme [Streptomyces sp. RFCAC02]|uniref:maleylpyruvate isomerase family mycothiol-dependent enzyme n=1 Tax=Streptomyces sp. RFCAC02 TaxID=2499143 RepID=UPI00101F3B6A|nr:maleylpyruvate isomerase family mycothiol-dependent enzyme [Streptomyces sp. RFCAC02]
MDHNAYLTHLRRELDAFRATLAGDLSAPVAHCGDWTLYDLANHLGSGNHWAARAVTEGHGDHRPPDAPRDPAELDAWFGDACAVLLDALDGDPATPAWTFFPPATRGFWQRRRALETVVHRWDAENAVGTPTPPDTDLADDGVSEVFAMMAPRQITRGRATPPAHALHVIATDTGTTWTYGPGEPVATVAGTAADLLLTLWGRLPATGPALTWTGDERTARKILAGPLVP